MPPIIRQRFLALLLLPVLLTTTLMAVTPSPIRAQTTTGKDIHKPLFEPTPKVQKLLKQAELEMSKYQWKVALKTLDNALKKAREIKDKPGEARVLKNFGNVYSDTGDPSKALEFYEKALLLYRDVGDKSWEASVLNNIGGVYSNTGAPSKALEFYQKALPIFQKVGNKAGEAKVLSNIGDIYAHTGLPTKALEFYQKVVPIFQKVGDKAGEASALNSTGSLYSDIGNPSKALEFYQKALRILQEVGDKTSEAGVLSNIGDVYSGIGNPFKALEFYQKALPVFVAVGDKLREASVLNSVGNVFAVNGAPSEALEFYQKALPIFQKVGDKLREAYTLNSMGIVYFEIRDPVKELEAHQQALSIFQAVGDKLGEASALSNLGLFYSDTGDYSRALEFHQKAMPIFQAAGNRAGEASALYIAGNLYLALSRLAEAEQALQKSIILNESIRTRLTSFSYETRTSFQQQGNKIHLSYLQVLLLQNKQRQAYDALQHVRGRTLLELFETGQVKLAGHLTEAEQTEEANLTLACNQATTRLLAFKNEAEADKAKEAVSTAESELNTFYDKLYAKYPDLATKRAVKTSTLEEIAASLPNDTALVEFLNLTLEGVGPEKKGAIDETVLFVVTRGADGKPNLVVHHLPVKFADLSEKVTDLREACADKTLRPYQSKAQELYQILLAPAEKELAGKSRLVICPNDVLWDVPFAVLMDKHGKHLIEKDEIALAYSGTTMKAALDAKKTQKSATEMLLALANPDFGDETRFGGTADAVALVTDRPITIPDRDVLPGGSTEMVRDGKLVPLPGTQKEAEAIMKNFGTKATVLLGKDAQEKTFKEKAGSYRYLHLATHGYFNDSAPFQSFVALAQPEKGDTENGLLTAREVFDLDLSSCELTVLSACETGRGEKKVGEGVVGLTWALFAAGCPTQVVSSWKVSDDATAELMTHFYHDLSTGKPKGESLRAASLSLLANDKYKHPYYWSPFVLVGDWR